MIHQIDKAIERFKRLSSLQRNLIVFFLLLFFVLLIYGKTVFFKYCIDDQYYLWLLIDKDSSFLDYIQALSKRFWGEQFRPVTFATFLFESIAFGEYPEVHHTFNLLYYTILCFIIYQVSRKFFRLFYKDALGLAFIISLLFLFHPSHANVVSSIKNREVILCLSFGLLALYYWWQYLETKKLSAVIKSGILLLLGIYSKLDAIVFMAIIPISSFLYQQKINYKRILIPVGGLAVAIFVAMTFIANDVAAPIDFKFEMSYIENPYYFEHYSFLEKIPYQLFILGMYEKFMLYPRGYYFYFGYDYLQIVTDWSPLIISLLIIHLIIFGSIIYLFFKKRYKLLLGPLFFFIGLAPFIITMTTGYVAVRYSFIASLGFCIVVSQILFYLLNKSSKKANKLGIIFFATTLIIWGYFSFTRSSAWKNIDTLYSTDIPKIKRSANANRMACQYYYIISEEEEDTAKQKDLILKSHYYCDQALSIYEIPVAIEYKAKGFLKLNEPEKALPLYDRLLEIDNSNVDGLAFFAYYYKYEGNLDASIFHFENLIRADSMRSDAFIELTHLYSENNQFEAAIGLNKYFYNLGNQYDALLNFGDIYIEKGDTLSALKNYNAALYYKQEDYIMEAILDIAKAVGNDTMTRKLEKLLNF